MGRERDRSRDRARRSRSRERRRSRSRDRSRDRSRRSRSRDRGKGSSAGPPPVAFLPPPVALNFAETNPQMQALAAMQQQQSEIQRQQMLQSLLLQQQALASIPGVTIGAIGTPAGTNAPSAATKKAREIYVGNLSVGVMSADLVRELFNSALANFVPDPVTNPPIVEVKMDTTGRFCFVETRTLELAAHLMELDKMEVNGRPLKIGRPKGYEDEALKLQSQQKLSMAQTFAAQLSGADTNVVLLENLMPAKNMLDPTERREIYDDVFSEAAKCGPVAGAAVPVPSPDVPEDEPCRVYVKYHSVEDAKRCKEMMDGRSFDDRILKASFSNDYDFTRAQQGEWIQSAPAIQQVALPQATLPQVTLPQVPGLAGLPPGVTIPVLPVVTMPDLTGLGGGLPHY